MMDFLEEREVGILWDYKNALAGAKGKFLPRVMEGWSTGSRSKKVTPNPAYVKFRTNPKNFVETNLGLLYNGVFLVFW